MPTMYEKVVSVIEKDVKDRNDFECQDLIVWFRNKSSLFKTLKSEIIKDVIRNCIFEKTSRDDVIIRQGESGDRLYIILRGKLSIYVLQDRENEQETKQIIEKVCAKPKLERSQLGQHVYTSVEGQSVGEIALIKEDCIRTASVVADEDTDLMVVDRALYNRSVRDVLEAEFHEKTDFVETNPLFKSWHAKMKKSLAISLKKESQQYGCPITKQGQPVDNLYFILSGEVEMKVNQGLHKEQYPMLWTEMSRLLPELLPPDDGVLRSPYSYETQQRKRLTHKNLPMCLLGANEVIGAVEMLTGMPTYFETATVTRRSDLLAFSRGNYVRLMNRKHSSQSIEKLKEMTTDRLFLYIHRTEMAMNHASLLKYLTLKLKDPESLKLLRISHRKKKGNRHLVEEHDREYFYGSYNSRRYDQHELNIISFLKMMGVYYLSETSLPELETSTRVLTDLQKRMGDWRTRSKGMESLDHREVPTPEKQKNSVKSYRLEAMRIPRSLEPISRSKTLPF